MHNLYADVWFLPSSQKFIRDVGYDLKSGISSIVLFPASADLRGFQQQLKNHLCNDLYLDMQAIDISVSDGRQPVEIFHEIFPQYSGYQYLEQMVEDDNHLPDVLLLHQFEKCQKTEQEKWIKDIKRWSEACRSSGSQHCLVLITNADAVTGIPLPSPDVRLKYHTWVGIPSLLESRLIYRKGISELQAVDQWREHLISSLAGNDLSLGEYLWEAVLSPVDEIQKTLKKYAELLGWSKASLEKKMSNRHSRNLGYPITHDPSKTTFELFCQGVILYTPENGEEIHSAALSIMDREQEVIHRIWRAQTTLALPMIDDIRLSISQIMINENGMDWAYAVDDLNTTYPELGKIKLFHDRLPNHDKRWWGKLLKQACEIRNELAHYRIISFPDFQILWDQFNYFNNRLKQTINQ